LCRRWPGKEEEEAQSHRSPSAARRRSALRPSPDLHCCTAVELPEVAAARPPSGLAAAIASLRRRGPRSSRLARHQGLRPPRPQVASAVGPGAARRRAQHDDRRSSAAATR
jgi:hypothetical protein